MRLTERILENLMENVTPRKFQQPLKNFVVYTEDEVKKLLRASWKTIHFLEICLMLHGLRYGEIRGLRFTDFNKRERTVTVRRQAVRLSDVDYAGKEMRISRTGIEIKATKTEEIFLNAMPVKLENDEIVLKETLIFEVPGFDEYSENLIKSSTIKV